MAELFTILKRKTRGSNSSSESGALAPKKLKRIYKPSFEADDEVYTGNEDCSLARNL